jgi:hypothetical protein
MGIAYTFSPALGTNINTTLTGTSNGTNNTDIQIMREIQEVKTTIKETSSSTLEAANRDVILTLLGISVPVTVAIFLFWLGQYTRRRNTIRRSCDTILRELMETREALQDEERRKCVTNN